MNNSFFKNYKPEIELSVIIPAYNETNRISPTIDSVCQFFKDKGVTYEVIIVDDGSTDGTYDYLNKCYEGRSEIIPIRYPENKGKGYAVKSGSQIASGLLILYLDADGSTKIDDYEKLEIKVKEGSDIAIGSRAIPESDVMLQAKSYRVVLGRMFNFLVNILCVPGIQDTQCGFKLFTRNAAETVFSRQTIDGFAFDCELLFIARKYKLSTSEVAVNWSNIDGSKVNLLVHPLYMFLEILRVRINEIKGMYR